MSTAVFSIISPNYRHYARVLMRSVQRHHPDWDRFVLLVGEAPGIDEELFTTVPLDALPLPDRRRFLFRYTVLELNTAVKPWMFEHLFSRGYDRVVYLDPDLVLFSALDELDAMSRDAFLILTPHLTGFIGGGDDHPSERTILQAGTYNLGFLAMSRQPQLETFLAWWRQKLEHECVVDLARGLFVDQKWMDLAPGLFSGVMILRHEGYNVAYWNLRQRSVSRKGDDYIVNGQPLRFFHFSGVNPAAANLVSKYDTLDLVSAGAAGELVASYRVALLEAGEESFKGAKYAFASFADGSLVRDTDRVSYRNSAALQSASGSDPFQHPEIFSALVDRRPAAQRGRLYRMLTRVKPLVRLVPRRLRLALRDVLLERHMARGSKAPLEPGLNIAGYLTHETGVGESARLCRAACEAAGVPVHAIDVENLHAIARQPIYRASVYHVNADQTLAVHASIPHVFEASSYNIGCWHWELPELPDAWIASADPLDEIWAPSTFIQSAISRKVSIPVVHMPHGIAVTDIEACSPEELGVPRGRFTFLCMFDLSSVVDRKNPAAAIEAFRRAFPDDARAALLIKTSHTNRHPAEYAALEERVREMPNVYLSGKMLSRARVNGLIDACDSVLSLHRSEGFGLILAEAMYLGKPVVATAWSGNMDFMNGANSCPVSYELVTLDRDHGVYERGQQWAEADVDHAAHLMRRIVDDTDFRRGIAMHARDTIRAQFSPEVAGQRYRRRLVFLRLMDRER